MDISKTRAKLLTRAELLQRGATEPQIAAAVRQEKLRRVHVGWYVRAKHWTEAYSEERHVMQVLCAVAAQNQADAVACGVSAAVMHGLPLYRVIPDHVHMADLRSNGRVAGSRLLARHEVPVPASDRVEVSGIACTTVDRTVFDLTRSLPYEAAVACADAALREVAWDDDNRTYDVAKADGWRESMRERLTAARGGRGIRQAREVIAFADGRAQRVLESVSRIRLIELGFAAPRLQVPVPGPRGVDYLIDFGLDEADVWGEADGHTKYTDLGLTTGATAEEVFRAEKEREDWIRGTTRRRVVRWGMADVATARALGRKLKAFGVTPRAATA